MNVILEALYPGKCEDGAILNILDGTVDVAGKLRHQGVRRLVHRVAVERMFGGHGRAGAGWRTCKSAMQVDFTWKHLNNHKTFKG